MPTSPGSSATAARAEPHTSTVPPHSEPSTTGLSPTGRRAAAIVAGIATLGLLLQFAVTLQVLSAQGFSLPGAVWRFLGFFTVTTNLLVAVTLARVARSRPSAGPSLSTVTGVVLAIGVVGVVYDLLLSGQAPEMGPLWWTADRTLHYLVPALTVLWWIACVPKHTLGVTDPPRWLAYPLGYLGYALARGAIDGWYPYFFVDVGRIGYPQTLRNAALLTLATLVAGYLLVGLVRLVRGPARGMAQ